METEAMEHPDRRLEAAGPPTLVMQSYQAMTKGDRRRLQKIGMAVMSFTVILPMVAGIFVSLPNAYWLFSAVGFFVGLCLLWPELGVWAVSAIPAAIAKLRPSLKDVIKPERRTEREAADGDA